MLQRAPINLYNLPQAPPRIVKIDGRTLRIQTYDIDNGYPQRMESLIKASPTASNCVKVFVKYLIGMGFKDANFAKAKINAKGLTPDKLLRRIVLDMGRNSGFAIHVNWNALYQVESVAYTSWKTTRRGMEPDEMGRIAIHPDWYNSTRFGNRVSPSVIDYIWKFDSNPEEIERQVKFSGGWDKYQGQIYWYSPEDDDYPLSPFDEVIEPMITEAKSNTTTRNNVESNFQLKNIIADIGKTESTDQRDERNKKFKHFIGPNGDPVMIVESTSTGVDGKPNDIPVVIPIESKIDDKLFQYTDDKTRGQIYRAMQQNAILHSDLTQGRYNQNQLPESQMYYNTLLTPDRNVIEECFHEIFSLFKTPINPTNDYSLIPLPTVIIPVVTTDTEQVDNNGNPAPDNTK